MTKLEIKENSSGIDMGGRYRVYGWYDDQWHGSGTLGPFDQKQAAIDGVDREIERYNDEHLCVVDRLGNIVYQAGNIDHEPMRFVIYLTFYRFPEEGYRWTFLKPFEKRKDAKRFCETHLFNKDKSAQWGDSDEGHHDQLITCQDGGVVFYQVREEVLL